MFFFPLQSEDFETSNIKKTFLSAALSLLLLVSNIPLVGAATSVSLRASDTVAGFSTDITVRFAPSHETIQIEVQKPDGGVIRLEEKADEYGEIRFDFVGFHTKRAGVYSVQAYTEGGSKPVGETSFEVFANETSSTASRIDIRNDSAPADKSEAIKITVVLKDKHGNPISDHLVELVSSRSEDEIIAYENGRTDVFGEAHFKVYSYEEGVSYFTAIDRNGSMTLEDREKGIFYATEIPTESQGRGGNLFEANMLLDDTNGNSSDAFGIIDHFELEIEEKIQVGSSSNHFTVRAVDKSGKTVKNYTGTILIAVPNDPGATTPGGSSGMYTFSPQDQGEKQFDLAFVFSKVGTQKIIVYDYENRAVSRSITGEITTEVVDECVGPGCSNEDPNRGEDDYITITRPSNNAGFGKDTITVSGKGKPYTNATLYLDGREIAEVEIGEDGILYADLEDIADGEHILHAETEQNDETISSDKVSFSIDTTPPTLDDVSIYPSGSIESGALYTVTLYSEPGLSTALVQVKGGKESAIEDEFTPGKYEATLEAPEVAGKYNVALTLEDDLKNTADYASAAMIEVVAGRASLDAPKNLKVESGDEEVLLRWDPVKDPNIDGYRLFMGETKRSLEAVSEVPSTKTFATIPELKNGIGHYFAVAAIDAEGQEGYQSNIIFATPGEEDVVVIDPPSDPDDLTLEVTPANDSLLLSWSLPNEETAYFDVRYGISSKKYVERFTVKGSKTSAIIQDLINGGSYYVTVVPLDANGVPTGERYPEVKGVPSYTGEHSAPVHEPYVDFSEAKTTTETGPELYLLLFVSLCFGFAFFLFQKSFRLFFFS